MDRMPPMDIHEGWFACNTFSFYRMSACMHVGGRDPWMNERGRPPYPPRRYGDDGPPPPEFGYRDPDRPPV